MRLFILAVIAGIGVLVGVALYVGQEIVNPGTPDTQMAANTNEDDSVLGLDDVESNERKDAESDAYKNQLREASFPAGTTSFDSVALRKQLPEIFQFPDQPAPQMTVSSTATEMDTVAAKPPGATNIGMVAHAPDAPVAGTTIGDRPDTPVMMQLTAPEHKPSVNTATNPNVQLETAPASEGRSARTRMIVNK